MRRIVLLAVSQCIGLTAFCQSPANAPGPALNPFDSSSSPQSLFSFGGGQAWQSAPLKVPSCNGSKVDPKEQKPESDPSHAFHPPCLDSRIFTLNALNNLEPPALPGAKWPHAKWCFFEPDFESEQN